MRVVFNRELVRGERSEGLRGEFGLEEALARLFRGTGITYSVEGDVVTLERAATMAAGEAATLPPLEITAPRLEDIHGRVDGFVATRNGTGSKTSTPLIEVPQSISVVTRDQLDARNVQDDSEALLYTPGVFAQPFGGDFNQFNPFYRIRGFPTSFGGSYVDDLVSPVNYRDEPYGVERYEVLRGPTSMLYGQSDPGGLINRIGRRPPGEAQHEVELQYGNYDRKQLAFDLGGPVEASEGALLYRLTFLGRNADDAVDYDEGPSIPDNRLFVAPAVTWNIRDDTTLTLLTSALFDDIGQPSVYVTPDYRTTRTRLDQPGADDFDYDQQYAGYQLEHYFDDTLSFRQKFRFMHMDYDYLSLAQLDITAEPVDGLVDRYAYGFDEERNDFLVDNNLVKQLTTGPVDHTVLVGADFQHLRDRVRFLSGFEGIPPLNLLDPDYSHISPSTTVDQNTKYETTNFGVYLQDQMRIWDKVVLTLGGRFDWSDSQAEGFDYSGAVDSDSSDDALTYRAGLTYLAGHGIAPYVSYAESFLPTAGTNSLTGESFDPTRGHQYEAGVKYQPPGFKGFFTVAAYELTKQDVVTISQAAPGVFVESQTGEIRSRGIELEGTAHITDALKIHAAYTYTNAEVTQSGTGNQGDTPALSPKHMASLWLDYTFLDGPLAGLGLGGGVRYVGSTYAWERDATIGDLSNPLRNDDYTLFDAAVRYDLGQIDRTLAGTMVAVNASNVLDDDYQVCYSRFDCQPGVPMTVIGSLRYRW
ncbi:MAG TPA: TonB-dependent siderophore receptor [Geminicoccaceae bacterium]|nr:TonB-dependent siderophore receptor [Geminicoccus sp.]HMU49084.1 TonB-dependent siderophore receptor [Geminicoccaceae bacterium]